MGRNVPYKIAEALAVWKRANQPDQAKCKSVEIFLKKQITARVMASCRELIVVSQFA